MSRIILMSFSSFSKAAQTAPSRSRLWTSLRLGSGAGGNRPIREYAFDDLNEGIRSFQDEIADDMEAVITKERPSERLRRVSSEFIFMSVTYRHFRKRCRKPPKGLNYSHSMVPGGFDVTS